MQTSRQYSFLVKSLKRNHAWYIAEITNCIHLRSLQTAERWDVELKARSVGCSIFCRHMLATDPTCNFCKMKRSLENAALQINSDFGVLSMGRCQVLFFLLSEEDFIFPWEAACTVSFSFPIDLKSCSQGRKRHIV